MAKSKNSRSKSKQLPLTKRESDFLTKKRDDLRVKRHTREKAVAERIQSARFQSAKSAKTAKTTEKVEKPRSEPEILHGSSEIQVEDFLGTFQKLTQATPRDQNGFLVYFLDHSMIPHDIALRGSEKQQKFLDAAKIKLNMLEGYLSFSFHKPVWNQLPHEPDTYFDAFRAFLLSHTRTIDEIATRFGQRFTAFSLQEAYTLFYWRDRASAYDILRPVAAAKLQDQRVLLAQDNHFSIAETIIRGLQSEIMDRTNESKTKRPFQGMKSSEVLQALYASIEAQRVSIGLPAKGPKQHPSGFVPAQFAGADRNIREAAAAYHGTINTDITETEKLRIQVDKVLADSPENAEKMQAMALDLILKTRQMVDTETVDGIEDVDSTDSIDSTDEHTVSSGSTDAHSVDDED